MYRLLTVTVVLAASAACSLLACRQAEAQGCRALRRVYTPPAVVVNKAAVVIETPVVATFAAIPVPVPVFSAFYAAGGSYPSGVYGAQAAGLAGQPAPAVASQSAQDSAVVEYLKKLEARMQALEQRLGGAPPQGQQGDPPTMLPADGGKPDDAGAPQAGLTLPVVYGKSCVACHDAKTAQREGAGFVLVKDGAVVAQPADKKLLIIQRTREGTMPPPKNKFNIPALDDAAFSALVEGLTK